MSKTNTIANLIPSGRLGMPQASLTAYASALFLYRTMQMQIYAWGRVDDCESEQVHRSVFLLPLKVRILTFGGGWKVKFYVWRNWRVKHFTEPKATRKCFEFVRMVFGGKCLKEIVRKRHCDLKIFAPAAGYPIQL